MTEKTLLNFLTTKVTITEKYENIPVKVKISGTLLYSTFLTFNTRFFNLRSGKNFVPFVVNYSL